MKRFLIAALVAAATVTTPVLAADDGILHSIGQPGFNRRIDLCDSPQPQAIYRQPRLIENVPMGPPVVSLRTPLLQAKYWGRVYLVRATGAATNTFCVTRNSMVIAGLTTATRAQG